MKEQAVTGVELYSEDPLASVKANKEVLMAVGTLHTPQILQLSKIGPKKLPKSVGIKTHVGRAGMGQDFQDHNNITTSMTIKELKQINPYPNDMAHETASKDSADQSRATDRTGPSLLHRVTSPSSCPLRTISPERHLELAAELKTQERVSCLVDAKTSAPASFPIRL
ncbi:uncharacterized protein FTOL_07904 [Fusarium torulosum]|uniref:Glucose-methanol-choline oxidoreductase N-terminal domain-containing protein n=1 Tax=Fusarium torulosum TaxID=33205 RepID=A0AAE8MCT7_9HYPO|nr:uncharacterized protein FTOL_07904 [Fusarium torulosum]